LDVLLSLKNQLGINLLACHYNHRLRGEDSYNDEVFVKKICSERGVECIVGSAAKENLFKNEDSAREARYAFFQKILGERRGAKIAVAHNSNDLAETYLMRLLRGSGIFGLISIPSARENFIRPLLSVSRLDIESYLYDKKIAFRIDKTNKNINITRNFLRLKIFPLLIKNMNPNLIETLSNSAKVMESDYDLIQKMTKKEYEKMLVKSQERLIILDRKIWLKIHPALKRSVIRMAVSNLESLSDITNKQVSEVCQMIEKGTGKKHKILPHSLRIELISGKINISIGIAKSSSQT
jgi:tRNA(Ile)-lysidine synthase